MSYTLSRMQKETLEAIRSYKETGATIYDLSQHMGLANGTVYKHIERLLDVKAVAKVYRRGDKKVYYVAGGSGDGMHVFPAMGETIKATPVASFLTSGWSFPRMARNFPLLVSNLSQFAWRWQSEDRNSIPEKAEIEETRKALIQLAQRCNHLSAMAMSLVNNETLWDHKKAFNSWYADESIPYDVETAKKYHSMIIEIIEQANKNG